MKHLLAVLALALGVVGAAVAGVLVDSVDMRYAEKKKLKFKVPKGTTIRAFLPRSQTGACYLAGYSKLIRT